MRTSESVSEPASSHWILWYVTVRTVAKKSASRTGWTSTSRRTSGSVRERVGCHAATSSSRAAVSSTLVCRESLLRASFRELDRRQAAVEEACVQRLERGADAVDVVRRDDDTRTRLAQELGGRAVGRDDGEDRPARREVLEDLPRQHALPATPRLGHQQEERLRVALEPQDSRRGAYSRSSSRSPRPRDSAHSRSVSRKSPTKRAIASTREPWSACRNGRGSRFPKKLPVWVIRKRLAGWYSSPAKSSKSHPLEMVRTAPRGRSARISSAIASETHEIASARRATRRASCSFAPAERGSRPCPSGDGDLRRAGHGGPRASARPSPSGPPPRRSGWSRAARS